MKPEAITRFREERMRFAIRYSVAGCVVASPPGSAVSAPFDRACG
jgi:hypothetical protein